MFVSDPRHSKKKKNARGYFYFKLTEMRTTFLDIDSDTVSLIQLLAQENSNGHAPLSKTPADKTDERRSLVKLGWDKLGGKAMYLWVTPCAPNESVQPRCNLSEQSQAGGALPRRGLLRSLRS